jgi:hypothetical protein
MMKKLLLLAFIAVARKAMAHRIATPRPTCDATTRSSFAAVAAFLKTADCGLLRRIRNNASFHYIAGPVR